MEKTVEIKVKNQMTLIDWLQLLFIALKFTGYIAWSWWLVLLPLEIAIIIYTIKAIIDKL